MRPELASVQLAALAQRQGGVVSRSQLESCGLLSSGISRWVRQGRLHRVHRGVYAVGHRAFGIEGRLHAALLHAGNGAALSHTTAARWWRLSDAEPQVIHVSAPGRRSSVGGSGCIIRAGSSQPFTEAFP